MKRILVPLLVLLTFCWMTAPLMAAELAADPAAIDPQSIVEVIALVMALIRGGCSVAIIVGLTLVTMQLLKKYLPESIPTKVVAVGVGAGLTALALFVFHTIDGSPPVVFTEVILAILGAPTVFEVLKGK